MLITYYYCYVIWFTAHVVNQRCWRWSEIGVFSVCAAEYKSYRGLTEWCPSLTIIEALKELTAKLAALSSGAKSSSKNFLISLWYGLSQRSRY